MRSTPGADRAAGAILVLISLAGTADVSYAGKRAFTVADGIESTRVMGETVGFSVGEGLALIPKFQDASTSPDGRRYVIRTVRGDIRGGGNRIEVLTGGTSSLDEASHVRTPATLFTKSLGSSTGYGSSALTFAHFNPLIWLPDSKRVSFLFSDGLAPIQLITINVVTGATTTFTHSPSDVVSFSLGGHDELIYSTKMTHSRELSQSLLEKGFAVQNDDVFSLLKGNADGYSILDTLWNSETFVTTPGHPKPRRIIFNRFGYNRWLPLIDGKISPDGRFAVVDASPDEVPDAWGRYSNPYFQQSFREARQDRNGFSARFIKQLFVVDMEKATAAPLWNAPDSTHVEIEWSPDSSAIIVGPNYIPEADDASGLAGHGMAIIDIPGGHISRLPLDASFAKSGIATSRWIDSRSIAVNDGIATSHFKKVGADWVATSTPRMPPTVKSPRIRIEQQQDLNTPPAIYAIDIQTKRRRKIRDLNAQLRDRVTLARVEQMTWADAEQRKWKGLLYYPVNFTPHKRFPLVIQTHGFASPDTFSLYGEGFPAPGLGPSFSVFAAQALANRNIAVLQVEDKNLSGIDDTPEEPVIHAAAYEAAISYLAKAGWLAVDKVGLTGFSRTGWHVEYALTHSPFKYAAAIVADNFDGSYVQDVVSNEHAEFEQTLGARPFGSGLPFWLERAPGFLADRVSAPLRLEVESGGLTSVLAAWEMFSRLRRLHKPVEMFVVPDIEHGTHALQNPMQCLAAQQGAVDWFDFWLNDREDPDPAKIAQYARWRALRTAQNRSLDDQE